MVVSKGEVIPTPEPESDPDFSLLQPWFRLQLISVGTTGTGSMGGISISGRIYSLLLH